jgi:DNA-binding CsgD family transcriptional regulator
MPAEVAAVIMQAYGLTERERTVTGLVCQGRSTGQIAAELWISPDTIQDHMKSVFNKTGVRSRREVIATILRDHYLPDLRQSRPVGPSASSPRRPHPARPGETRPAIPIDLMRHFVTFNLYVTA